MLKHATRIVESKQQGTDGVLSALVPTETGHDTFGRTHVLDLDHRAFAWQIHTRFGLRDHSVSPAPSKRVSQSRATRGRAWPGWDRRAAHLASNPSSAARRAPSGAVKREGDGSTSNATNEDGSLSQAPRLRDAAGCNRNCSASKSSPPGVAITISPSTTQLSEADPSMRHAARENSGRAAARRGFGYKLHSLGGKRSPETRPTSVHRYKFRWESPR